MNRETTFAVFNLLGNIPIVNDWLIIKVKGFINTGAKFCTKLTEIPSLPVEVLVLSLIAHMERLVAWLSCLIHPSVRDKRRVSEIDLSQPRYETAFWWRHNEPVTSQLTDRIKWPNYPVELIGIYVHINTHNKESLTQRSRRSTNVQLCLIFLYISIWFES